MSDLLRMDYINSLPQPLLVDVGGRQWPLNVICVQTGALQIDVCGLHENMHVGEVLAFIDDDGVRHDPETFYSDFEGGLLEGEKV